MNEEVEAEDVKNIQMVCAKYGYPILLTEEDSINAVTIDVLKKLRPVQIYLYGDAADIGSTVVKDLKQKTGIESDKITRIHSGREIK
jgi:spermidine/putrescine-binding protein